MSLARTAQPAPLPAWEETAREAAAWDRHYDQHDTDEEYDE